MFVCVYISMYVWIYVSWFQIWSHILVSWVDTITNDQLDGILNGSGSFQGSLSSSECEAVGENEECTSNSKGFCYC